MHQDENKLVCLIKKLSDDINEFGNRSMRSFGLTVSQVLTLDCLYKAKDQEVNIRQICSALGLSHATVLGIVNRLQEKGWVDIKVGVDDHRMRIVTLTDKSNAMLSKFFSNNFTKERQLLAGFSDEETECLFSMLDRISDNLNVFSQDVAKA